MIDKDDSFGQFLAAMPCDNKEGPNCGVTAVALVAGVTFGKAWNTFKAMGGRYAKKRWTGGTTTFDQAEALRRLGIEFKSVPFNKCALKTLCPTLERGKVYMVTTTRHVQVVFDEFVADQNERKHIDQFWGRNKMVTRIREIKNPYKNSVEIWGEPEQTPASKPIIIQPQSGASLFPSLFPQQTSAAQGQQLSLF